MAARRSSPPTASTRSRTWTPRRRSRLLVGAELVIDDTMYAAGRHGQPEAGLGSLVQPWPSTFATRAARQRLAPSTTSPPTRTATSSACTPRPSATRSWSAPIGPAAGGRLRLTTDLELDVRRRWAIPGAAARAPRPDRRRWAAALAVALMVLLGWPGATSASRSYDLYQHVIGPAPLASPRRVHVVVIDADSLADVGGWPWTRFSAGAAGRADRRPRRRRPSASTCCSPSPTANRLAEFVAGLSGRAAARRRRTRSRPLPSMDAIFARVIGRNPVVLARAGVDDASYESGAPPPRTPRRCRPRSQFVGPATRDDPELCSTAVANLGMLDGAPWATAWSTARPDGRRAWSAACRCSPAARRADAGPGVELVRAAEGVDTIQLEGDARADSSATPDRRAHRRPRAPAADGLRLLMAAGRRRRPVSRRPTYHPGRRRAAPGHTRRRLQGLHRHGRPDPRPASDVVTTPRVQRDLRRLRPGPGRWTPILRSAAPAPARWAAPVRSGASAGAS